MKKNESKFKVGEKVEATVVLLSGKRHKVTAVIKSIEQYWGRTTYTLTDAIVADFNTRTIKKLRETNNV